MSRMVDRIRVSQEIAISEGLDIICLLMSKDSNKQLLRETTLWCGIPRLNTLDIRRDELTQICGIPIQITPHVEDLFLVTREKSFLNGYFDLYGCKFHPDDYLESSDAT